MKIMIIALVSMISMSASAANYCNADGVLTAGRHIYAKVGNQFQELDWYFYRNYWARILKRVQGDVVNYEGKVIATHQKFLLIAQADANSCGSTITWIPESDFTTIP